MSIIDPLISYIAPGAPATRRPSEGKLAFLRPEIGFTPKWYHNAIGIDFGEKWHTNTAYRKEAILSMRQELDKRFPQNQIGYLKKEYSNPDLLTGTFGACTIAAIYGVPIRFEKDQWPTSEHFNISDVELNELAAPNLDKNTFFQALLDQVQQIKKSDGQVIGFINFQGVLNNAQRIRGQELFMDMLIEPEKARHLFECVSTTMIDAAKQLHKIQSESGVNYRFFTISNCLVNMLSPELYREMVFPYDLKIANAFETIGIHNCAWNADPYLQQYSKIPNLAYIDMGIESKLPRAKYLFPGARRAIMYTPMDLKNKNIDQLKKDLEQIAKQYGPCDIVAADIEWGTPDQRVLDFIRICEGISQRMQMI